MASVKSEKGTVNASSIFRKTILRIFNQKTNFALIPLLMYYNHWKWQCILKSKNLNSSVCKFYLGRGWYVYRKNWRQSDVIQYCMIYFAISQNIIENDKYSNKNSCKLYLQPFYIFIKIYFDKSLEGPFLKVFPSILKTFFHWIPFYIVVSRFLLQTDKTLKILLYPFQEFKLLVPKNSSRFNVENAEIWIHFCII